MLDIYVNDPRFYDILDVKQNMKVVAQALTFTEGPIWNKEKNYLTFSDIPESRIYRWSEKDGLSVLCENTNLGNGSTYTADGRILNCQHAKSRVAIFSDEGEELGVLATHYNGKELNSPNDIIVSSKGVIYFSDPNFGRANSPVGIPRELEQDIQAVYFMKEGDSEPTRASNDFTCPNGLCFSPDEKKMYVAETTNLKISVFDVEEDGTLSNYRNFADTQDFGVGRPDGIKIDKNGYILCAAQGGIHYFTEDGTFLGVVKVKGHPTNFCFGDEDGLGVYITSKGTVYKYRIK